jgi:hypothetical protein
MTDRHKRYPIPFRPAGGDESWLRDHAKHTGQAVNAILRQALAEYRQRQEADVTRGLDGAAVRPRRPASGRT